MSDRYTKIVLTVIAGALIYIAIALTAFPAVSAQGTQRPGEPSGPLQVVVVGWNQNTPVPVTAAEPLRVITERSSGMADRMIVVGYEEGALRERAGTMHNFAGQTSGVPVVVRAK
ncbi:MAG TPA: hypothetical protein VF491_02445 [Vicinamibacterales bacterium]